MSITLYSLGAAEEVTGSKHIFEIDGRKFLVDCGAFQGKRKISDEKNRNFDIEADKLESVILTHVIIAIGEDIQASILTTLMIKEMGNSYITAKAQNAYHGKVLEKIGADHVVHPERDMGIRIGHHLVSRNVVDYLELSDKYSLVELKVTNSKFFNKTLLELNFRQRYGLNVIGIRRGQEMIISPAADAVIQVNDTLMIVGGIKEIDWLENQMP